MSSLYDLLGVSKGASDSEIKKAYHKMAKTLHPDVNPDKSAQEKFKNVSKAYEILSDKDKRARYDAGEIDNNGNPTPFGSGSYDSGTGFGGFGGGRTYRQGNTTYTNINPEDLAAMFGGMGGMGRGNGFDFADLFGMGGMNRGARTRSYNTSQNVQYNMSIPFNLAITGGETTISIGGKKIKMRVPAGVTEDAQLRLKGQGENGGDALIKLHIEPSVLFTREGNDLIIKVPLTLKEAVLGTKITLPLPAGPVVVKVPENTSGGKVLRLKNKGVTGKGDCLIHFSIVLPEKTNRALTDFVQNWSDPTPNPRKF
ncbi:MAG: J domain-containing protein [Alphaproteobacteria bacterium]|nr:J domain-containing protein [Alphaproteobacteria bacterium]